ncbi:MAG TPA: hypothetical protein VK949_07105 [Methylotenera sp.]|nr:hypothetical protein [Methylotenera sp.]
MLQSVPWTDVIRNAPKVADAAKKLWSTVSGRPDQTSVNSPFPDESPKSQTGLETRVTALQETVSDLHNQMLASSELIKVLAEQNAQLIARIETNRIRMLWLSIASGVTSVIAVISLVIVLHNVT